MGEKKLTLILDAIGGKIQKQCYKILAPMGRLVIFGSACYTPGKNRPKYLKSMYEFLTRPLFDPLSMISENKSVMAFNLIWLWDQLDLMNELITEMAAFQVKPHVGKEFHFEEAHKAIDWLRSGKSIGKVVLTNE